MYNKFSINKVSIRHVVVQNLAEFGKKVPVGCQLGIKVSFS